MDWLQQVMDNADRPTLGGNLGKRHALNLPWCNARAACKIETIEFTVSMKGECSIALFPGNITVVGVSQF